MCVVYCLVYSVLSILCSSDANMTISTDLCLMDNIEISEYSYFRPQVMLAWAGPQHWKLRPRNRNEDVSESERLKCMYCMQQLYTMTISLYTLCVCVCVVGSKDVPRKQKHSKHVFRVDFTRTLNEELFKRGKVSRSNVFV